MRDLVLVPEKGRLSGRRLGRPFGAFRAGRARAWSAVEPAVGGLLPCLFSVPQTYALLVRRPGGRRFRGFFGPWDLSCPGLQPAGRHECDCPQGAPAPRTAAPRRPLRCGQFMRVFSADTPLLKRNTPRGRPGGVFLSCLRLNCIIPASRLVVSDSR